ncbi:Transposase [Rickettsia tamurae subsp. buchneri]|uniref:Mutator family transposase n=1 Tax=Rickettsia tamurae subsp. buchneri TaxID=1462938 RepID=A0A8E0WL36_9RICK|nr:transposase, Mutator family [Rickettsia endosymbiont of Ixodes scapularis]KDO02529.1 Transposase [Rickettsia tamurae subsp. buchneri]
MQLEKNKKINEAIDLLVEGGADLKRVLGQDGLIKELSKGILERALQAEMSEHLGYSKYGRKESENARNGNFSKNVTTENGAIELNIPRDRTGKFEPMIVGKKQTRIDGLDQKIISLYAKGMSLSDIRIQLQELYGAEISESLISRITDEVIDEVRIWQSRPLESIYPIVYFDCLVVKVRQDKQIINKSVYVALGIDLHGRKDILGLWISENEGAKFWLNNFTELKNRGVKDILIACSDNLSGMSEAILAVYPKTEHQLCIVHQIRNSLLYVSYKDREKH